MREVELEHADDEVAGLVDYVKGGDVIIFTRNGREVARVERARESAPRRAISGAEAVSRFEALQERVRDRWSDEPEFDWKDAVQSGRR